MRSSAVIRVYFGPIEADLGCFPVSCEAVKQLAVAAEERLQHRVVFLCRELPPGRLHASIQSSHVLQDAVERNCDASQRSLEQSSSFRLTFDLKVPKVYPKLLYFLFICCSVLQDAGQTGPSVQLPYKV